MIISPIYKKVTIYCRGLKREIILKSPPSLVKRCQRWCGGQKISAHEWTLKRPFYLKIIIDAS
jgi:hypothetical protein